MQRTLLCLLVVTILAGQIFAQNFRKYENFRVEFDQQGNVIGLTANENACGKPKYQTGIITRVSYGESYKNDGKSVRGVAIRYANGKTESFAYEAASPSFSFDIWSLAPSERRPIDYFFTRNRPVIVGTQVCGSAGFESMVSIKDRSPRVSSSSSTGIAPRMTSDQSTRSVTGRGLEQAKLVGALRLKPDGPGCYFSSAGHLIFFDGDEAWMNIDARDVKLHVVSESDPKGKLRVGSRITKRYSATDISVDLVQTLTKKSAVSSWSGIFTVRKGARSQSVRATGICGD